MSGGGVSSLGTAFLMIMSVTAAKVASSAGTDTPVGLAAAAVSMVGAGLIVGEQVAAHRAEQAERKRVATQRAQLAMAKIANDERTIQADLQAARDPEVRQALAASLDALQLKHADLMKEISDQDLDLPLPDAERMTAEEYRQAQEDWRTLNRGDGQIQVGANATPAFQDQLRSMHAKLLSGPSGRKLLHGILHPAGALAPIIVSPLPPDEATAEQRIERAKTGTQMEQRGRDLAAQTLAAEQRLNAAMKLEKGKEKLPPDRMKYWDAQFKEHVIDPRKRYRDDVERLGGNAALQPPAPGLASKDGTTITVRQGLRDSELVSHDKDGNPILTPAFLIYGHEMVHALRRRQEIVAPPIGPQFDLRWQNNEELQTIDGDARLPGVSENSLRQDHGLPPRAFISTQSFEAAELARAAH